MINHKDRGSLPAGQFLKQFLPRFPNMRDAVMAWAVPTEVWVTGKRQVDYKTVESNFQKTVRMFRVPSGQPLDMSSDGQRKWNSETIYADNTLELKVDDIIIFNSEASPRYRVINKVDWKAFGYFEYTIVSDYRGI